MRTSIPSFIHQPIWVVTYERTERKIHFLTFDTHIDVFTARIVLCACSMLLNDFKRIRLILRAHDEHVLNDLKRMLSMRLKHKAGST
jgi:hypothetical protein